MKRGRDFLDRLRADSGKLPIPESLKPEWIEETIREREKEAERQEGLRRRLWRGRVRTALVPAACICLIAAGLLGLFGAGLLFPEAGTGAGGQSTAGAPQPGSSDAGEGTEPGTAEAEEQDTLRFAEKSYEEIYEILQAGFQETQIQNENIAEYGEEESISGAMLEESQAEAASDSAGKEFGGTNVQTEGVDEADTVKNDGRYLYQLAERRDENGRTYQGIQVVDTKGGLRETAFVGRFEYAREFYVSEGLLIVLEDGYDTADYMSGAEDSLVEDRTAESAQVAVCTDVLYTHNQYTRVHIYDISDRENPALIKTFSLDGAYSTSRLSDGYFYGFTFFTPDPGEGEQDYSSYIPEIDGALIPAKKIICPEETDGNEYLVMISIDLKQPQEILDSRAVLADSGVFYVSRDNIYLASWYSIYEDGVQIVYGGDGQNSSQAGDGQAEQEGQSAEISYETDTLQDYTQLLRFSYENGRFLAKAEGSVPGRISDSFHLDQNSGYLRAVTTVTECIRRQLVDDKTGETLGYEYVIPEETDGLSNGLYILDENLEITGRLDGLAEGEQLYSARFLGDTAYFVTFRQTDPLFAVDMSDPEKPRLLSELKVSGFSEYLHFYSGSLLFGLGYEADEETGEQQGLKLSMFDLSDSSALLEEARLLLPNYTYSPALYDHKSLLIDSEQNLIGFEAQGIIDGSFGQAYLLFSYENGEFVQRLEIVKNRDAGVYGSCRGTFIGDRFYLLIQDGRVQEYSLETGELTGELPEL